MTDIPCAKCEEMMQPFLDRVLTAEEMEVAEMHLDRCSWCRKRYRFETELRQYVRVAVGEPMPEQLKLKLSALRTPLE